MFMIPWAFCFIFNLFEILSIKYEELYFQRPRGQDCGSLKKGCLKLKNAVLWSLEYKPISEVSLPPWSWKLTMYISDSDSFPDCTLVLFSPSCLVSSTITLTGRAQLTQLCIGPMNVPQAIEIYQVLGQGFFSCFFCLGVSQAWSSPSLTGNQIKSWMNKWMRKPQSLPDLARRK